MTLVIDKRSTLDIRLGLISDFHQKVGLTIDHVFEDSLVDASRELDLELMKKGKNMYTAPRLSELETKRYSFPSAKSWSRTPD